MKQMLTHSAKLFLCDVALKLVVGVV